MSIRWSLALNLMRSFLLEFSRVQALTGSEPLKLYELSILTCFYATYKMENFRGILSNPLLERAVTYCRDFVSIVNEMSGTAMALLGQTIDLSLERIERYVKASRKKSYLVLCDCLSLPEFTYIFTSLAQKTPCEAFFAINPGGKTKTFQHLTGRYLSLSSSYPIEVSLMEIAKELAKKFKCSGYMLFRGVDQLVHSFEKEGFASVRDMIEKFHKEVSKLVTCTEELLTKYTVLLLTDHGYDVKIKDERLYPYHKWGEGLSLSIIAPMLVASVS